METKHALSKQGSSPTYITVARHPRFIPEIARRLGNRTFTKDLIIDAESVNQFVERRELLLLDILRGLDKDSRAALALIYMRNGRLESPIQPQASETIALERLGSTIGGCLDALEALNGSLVWLSSADGDRVWQFNHPTVGDAYAEILAQSPEHIDILIQGTEPERLLGLITCGEVGLEKAVVVPKTLFPQIIGKLGLMKQGKLYGTESLSAYRAKNSLHSFLTSRCSPEFLCRYLQHNSDLLTEVSKPGLLLYAVSEVPLAKRLHELELLPDKHRRRFVETVSDYAVDGRDASALDDKNIRGFFTESEFEELVQKVRSETVPRLADIRSQCEDAQYSESESPEEQMQEFFDYCDSLLSQFGDDQDTAELIDLQKSLAWDWVYENEVDWPDEELQHLGQIEETEGPESSRSIFEDVDEDEEHEAS